jgi:gluconate 2-dehydrogenase gamma chain
VMPRDETEHLFFDDHQWHTIEAAMARIIPTDRDPGAREANTVRFVDRYLSGIEYIYAKPDGSGFRSLSGKEVDVWQSRIRNLQAKYVEGIVQFDDVSRQRFNDDFVSLTADDQDRVLHEIARSSEGELELLEEAGATAAFVMPEASMQQAVNEHQLDFFPLLVLHTRQGFYADPVYGGNQGHVGWKTIGFPGPDSMSKVHQGRYSTLPYFAESSLITQPGE